MSRNEKSIRINYVMNVILQASTFIFPLISFPYISRVLLPEGTGKVNMAISVVAYFIMLAQLGIPTYGVIQCAKIRDNREKLSEVFGELFTLNVITTISAYIILVGLIFLVPKLSSEKILYFVVSLNVILGTIGIEWLYQAVEEYTYITIRSLITKTIAVVGMFLLVKTSDDYVVYAAISVFASGAAYLVNFIRAKEYVDIKLVNYTRITKHLKPVLVFFAVACTTTIYTNLDNVMLGFVNNDTEVGYYSAAIRIKVIIVSLITAIGTVILPRASYLIEKNDYEKYNSIIRNAVKFSVLIATPIMIYFIMFAEESINLIAGPAYGGSIRPMQVLMPTVVMIAITNVIGFEMLVPTGRERKVLHSTVVGALVDLVLNLALIPQFGALGAAIGTLAAEISVLIYQIIVLEKEEKDAFSHIPYGKITVAILLAICSAIFIKHREYTLIKTLIYSAMFFFFIYGTVLIVLKEEMIYSIVRLVGKIGIFSDTNRGKTIQTAFAIVLIIKMIESTFFASGFSGLQSFLIAPRMISLCVAVVVILLNYLDEMYNKRLVVVLFAVTIIIGISTFFARDLSPLIFWIFIVATIDVDYTEIIKLSAIVHFIIIIAVVLLSDIGILPTVTVLQADRVRAYLGFGYTTTAPNYLLYTTLMWIYYRKNKITWPELLSITVLASYLFYRTDTKSAFALTIIAIASASLLKICDNLRTYKDIYGVASLTILGVFPTTMCVLSRLYDVNTPWMEWLNKFLTGRLRLGNEGFQKFGITIFGQKIVWYGGDLGDEIEKYNYVDSSYLQMLFMYGIIILILVVIYLFVIEIAGIKKKDTYLLLVLSLFIVHSTFDPQLIWLEFNTFLMALSYLSSNGQLGKSLGDSKIAQQAK